MEYENRERMGGLCAEENTCSRDPSWLQIAGSMYHMDFKVVKQFFRVPHERTPVDKPETVSYSEQKPSEKALFMMLRTLLDRYIFTELLSPFGLSLGVLCFIILTKELLNIFFYKKISAMIVVFVILDQWHPHGTGLLIDFQSRIEFFDFQYI